MSHIVQAGDLDVSGSVSGTEWRRWVEVRAAEEYDVHGYFVGSDLDHPAEVGQAVERHALHIVAMAHKRYDSRGHAYYARKLAAGKGTKGALRSLKRRLSEAVFRRLIDDQKSKGPERADGGDTHTSAADLIPIASTSERPLPGRTADHTPVPAPVS